MDKKTRSIIENIKTIAIILLILYIALGGSKSKDQSHGSEYTDEQAEESAYWFNMGYERGYSEAEYEARSEYDRGYSQGKYEAQGEIEEAKRYGSDNAYDAGYEKGYWDGYSDCEEENGLAEPGGTYYITKEKD